MMPAPQLLHGPYTRPKVKLGEPIEAVVYYRDSNEVETRQVLVTGWSQAPITWPLGRTADGSRDRVLLCGDLVRAVSLESVATVSYWWGVSRWTVQRWRRALGVHWYNPGTAAAWSEASKKRKQKKD